jgi:hypothetical protein
MDSVAEIQRAIAEFAAEPNSGLIVTSSILATIHSKLIIDLAARHRLPAVYSTRLHVVAGGLSSYGPAFLDQFRGAADYVDRILRGAKPAELPVQVRGPHGGYVLAREQRRITAADILRAAGTVNDESEKSVSGSALLVQAAGSILAKAENAFLDSLSRISVEDLARTTPPKLRKATK